MYPRAHSRGDTYYSGGAFSDNTYWLFDRNYLRLKNLEIGYTVPMGKQNVVQRFRVYLRGFNLLTFSKNKIYDPEGTNSAGTFYPQARIISGGFSLAF